MKFLVVCFLCLLLAVFSLASNFAVNVVSYSNLGYYPYNLPESVLGKPSQLVLDPGSPPIFAGVFRPSMVYGAWNVAPDGTRLITTIRSNGHIIVEFNPPIYDHPNNWYGKDFIVFGNSAFTSNQAIQSNTNMEICKIKNGIEGIWEPMTVSVSQDGIVWHTYTNGPYADDFAPANPYAWDYVEDTWGPELDFTKPIAPNLSKSDFADKTVAEGIDMYLDSAGGTAFDISQFNLPVDPSSGLKWIKYVRVQSNIQDEDGFIYEGEIDGFARVGTTIQPISIGEAKKLPDGSRVILKESIVSASTFETGRLCYIQHPDRSNGLAVLGRNLERGQVVAAHGIMETLNNQKVLRCTAIELISQNAAVEPLTLQIKSIGSEDTGLAGCPNVGLLVRLAGKVSSRSVPAKTFEVIDGGGRPIKCIAPTLKPQPEEPLNPTNPNWGIIPDPSFLLPQENDFVVVTGIVSTENSSEGLVPVIRLRGQSDLAIVTQ